MYQKNTNTPSKQKYDDTNLYANNVRMNTLVNESAHRRAGGKSLAKRSDIKRPATKNEQCKFMMALYVDTVLDRWYLKPGIGCRQHQHHAKPTKEEISQSLRRMNKSNKKTASNLMQSNVGESSGSSFMYKEKNMALTHCQMHHIERMARDISLSNNGAVLQSSSPTDKMIQYMKNTPSISFIVLYHEPESNDKQKDDFIGPNPHNKPHADDLAFELKYDIYSSSSAELVTRENAGTDDIRLLCASIDSNDSSTSNNNTSKEPQSSSILFQSDEDCNMLQQEIKYTRAA